jgi:mannitol-1-phosphate 5-dehydrogenase
LRKLSTNDRLIRPLLGTLEYGLPHGNLVSGVAAALCYRNDTDQQAQEMQTVLAHDGAEVALARFSGNALLPEILSEIVTAWRRLAR